MVTKEECEELGMEFVEAYYNNNGVYVKSFCRRKAVPAIFMPSSPMVMEGETIEELGTEEHFPYPKKVLAKDSGKMRLKNKEIKNIKVVNRNMHSIEGKIDTDIHRQDFEDIPIQDSRLMRDAEKEGHEGMRLNRAQEIEGEKRHSVEKARRSKKNLKALGKNVRAVKKKIRRDRRSKKRETKLERLNSMDNGTEE